MRQWQRVFCGFGLLITCLTLTYLRGQSWETFTYQPQPKRLPSHYSYTFTNARAPNPYQGKLSDESVAVLHQLNEELESIQEKLVKDRELERYLRIQGNEGYYRRLYESLKSLLSTAVTQETTSISNVDYSQQLEVPSRTWQMPAINESWNEFFYPEPLSSGLNVIINANYRSGSSFTGDLLNLHQDFMYMFEPLRLFTNTASEKADEETVNEVFSRMLLCDYRDNDMPKSAWRYQVLCGVHKECNNPLIKGSRRHFWDINYPAMCHSKPNHAIKTIRVAKLEHLETLMRQRVKIIQLIRDPRATALSRGLLQKPTKLDSLKVYCDQRLFDLMYIKKKLDSYNISPSDVIYYLRYEDLAINPLSATVGVYEFLGIDPDENVISWAVDVAEKNLNVESDMQNASNKREGRYSTSRSDPAYTAQAWRKTLPTDVMRYVQDICGDFLHVFGYTIFQNELDLTNFHIPTIQSLHSL